jgi:hypothetical protein
MGNSANAFDYPTNNAKPGINTEAMQNLAAQIWSASHLHQLSKTGSEHQITAPTQDPKIEGQSHIGAPKQDPKNEGEHHIGAPRTTPPNDFPSSTPPKDFLAPQEKIPAPTEPKWFMPLVPRSQSDSQSMPKFDLTMTNPFSK